MLVVRWTLVLPVVCMERTQITNSSQKSIQENILLISMLLAKHFVWYAGNLMLQSRSALEPGVSFRGVKRPRSKSDHVFPTGSEVRGKGRQASTPSYSLLLGRGA